MAELGLTADAAAGRDAGEHALRSGEGAGGSVSRLDQAGAAAIVGEWRDLAARGAEASVFFHPGILLPAIGHFDEPVTVAAVRQPGGRLMGLAPIERIRFGRLAPVARIWVHDYGPLGTPLFDASAVDLAAAALLDAAPRGLVVPYLPTEGPAASALRRAAERADRPVALVDTHARAVLDRSETPAGVRAALPTRRRREYARQMRRLGDLGAVTVETATDADRVRARFEEFLTLESTGWKGDRGTALACRAATAAFARDIVFNRSERGTVRIVSLRLGDHPLAIVVCFVAGATTFTWKIAYDEAFARFSPGAQLMLEAADALFRDPTIARIDSCASANHPMIDHLWPGRLALATLVVGPPGGGFLHRAGLAAARAEIRARAAARDLRARIKAHSRRKETGS